MKIKKLFALPFLLLSLVSCGPSPASSSLPATDSASASPSTSAAVPPSETPPPSTPPDPETLDPQALVSVDWGVKPIGTPDRPFSDTVCASLDFYFLEMYNQYGDSLLVTCRDAAGAKSFNMLIDAGQNADGVNSVQPALAEYAENEIDFAVFTHGHADHVGGFKRAVSSVATTVSIGTFLDFGYRYVNDKGELIGDYSSYQELRNSYVFDQGSNYCRAYDSVRDNVCPSTYHLAPDLTFEVLDTGLYVEKPETAVKNAGANDTSLTGILRYKDFSLFLSGDLDQELNLIKLNPDLGRVTVMKAGHHGSDTSNSRALLDRLQPEAVIISAAAVNKGGITDGRNNDHPNPTAIANFLKTPSIGEQIYLNMTMGTIRLSLDPVALSYSLEGLGPHRLVYQDPTAEANKESEGNYKLLDTYFYRAVVNAKSGKTLKESVEAQLA